MKKAIYPCLWFDGQAQNAANLYCSIFKNARITSDSPVVVKFEINGQEFMGLNGGPNFKFNEAMSLVVECETQEEIDTYWEKLTSDGGQESQCGWLKDKFGVSWQIIPTILSKLMGEPEKASRVMDKILKMKKLGIETLIKA